MLCGTVIEGSPLPKMVSLFHVGVGDGAILFPSPPGLAVTNNVVELLDGLGPFAVQLHLTSASPQLF